MDKLQHAHISVFSHFPRKCAWTLGYMPQTKQKIKSSIVGWFYCQAVILTICTFSVVATLQNFFTMFGSRSLRTSPLDVILCALCDAIRPGQEVKQRPHCGSLNQQALRMDFSWSLRTAPHATSDAWNSRAAQTHRQPPKPKPQIMSGTWKRSCGPAAE